MRAAHHLLWGLRIGAVFLAYPGVPRAAAEPSPPAAEPSAAAAATEKLAVEEVLRLALSSHPSLEAARAQASAAEEQSKSARGRLLPVISVHDELQHWDSPFTIALGPAPVTAREQDTNTFIAAATQPLLGLLGRISEHAARVSGAQARAVETEVVEAGLREEIQTQYLRLFEARAMRQIAQAPHSKIGQSARMPTNAEFFGANTWPSTR